MRLSWILQPPHPSPPHPTWTSSNAAITRGHRGGKRSGEAGVELICAQSAVPFSGA